MSTKPSVLAQPPKIAGLKPPTPAPAPAENKKENSSEETKITFPQPLPGGALLLDIIGSGQHSVRIIKQTDPSQKYEFLADCICGVQGRGHVEADVRGYAGWHIENKKK
jgi:hypothetical protein